jgi:hypothetical protein
MIARFQLLVHPELRDQLRELRVRSQADPTGAEAQQFEAVRVGWSALREGREADFDGERLGFSDRHPDLRDCAEIKLPVVQEFNRRKRPMGPSHRLTYREFDGLTTADLPVRQIIAFEPRKNGRPFDVTARRLGRTKGVALSELDSLPNVRPAVGPNKDARRLVSPVRMPLPPDIAQAMKTLDGLSPASGAATAPVRVQTPSVQRRTPHHGHTRAR